ncbi:type II CRISPR-associated endonuclease Cas1 [Lentisphaerota bacterium ZTH]|nr:type II CRISPR-associated endonuclease Cas1 [Lentisphaerota bacterium]WET07126.1 type II CRISPR-associated endonuclease Cas1 [Lentisphaerota bacterium ZTH]
MTDRIIDISGQPVFLNVTNRLLAIRNKEGKSQTLPLGDVAALLISNNAATMTHAVLDGIASSGGIVVICDQKHMPSGMLLPMQGHYIQTERFTAQAAASLPLKKRIWRQIVRDKIRNQATVLKLTGGDDGGLLPLVSLVRSGDSSNIEARAAKIYWRQLFKPVVDFKRDFDQDGINSWLNYGYAVLRAMTARAICASGLHPTLGVNHHNRYNPFCLADDLMEPFRPVVDLAVCRLLSSYSAAAELDAVIKREIISAVLCRVVFNGESITIFNALAKMSASLAFAFENNGRSIALPDDIFAGIQE